MDREKISPVGDQLDVMTHQGMGREKCIDNINILGCIIWYVRPQFSNQGLNHSPPHWECRVLTTGPPGKSDNINNKIHIEPLKQLTSVTAPNSPSDPPMKEAIFISISEMSTPRLREGK